MLIAFVRSMVLLIVCILVFMSMLQELMINGIAGAAKQDKDTTAQEDKAPVARGAKKVDID